MCNRENFKNLRTLLSVKYSFDVPSIYFATDEATVLRNWLKHDVNDGNSKISPKAFVRRVLRCNTSARRERERETYFSVPPVSITFPPRMQN